MFAKGKPRKVLIHGQPVYLYDEQVGTVGPKLHYVSAFKGKQNANRTNFLAEGPNDQKIVRYLEKTRRV